MDAVRVERMCGIFKIGVDYPLHHMTVIVMTIVVEIVHNYDSDTLTAGRKTLDLVNDNIAHHRVYAGGATTPHKHVWCE